MTDPFPIDPGPDHITIFETDGDKTIFRVRPRPDNAVKLPGRIGGWIIHVPDVKNPVAISGEGDGDLHWPGIIGPGQFGVHRAFNNLGQMRDAMPEIRNFVTRAEALQLGKPHVILTASHSGQLDPAHVEFVVDTLREAGMAATVIVDHKSTPGE